MPEKRLALLLDANAVLHYKRADQIDWHKVCGVESATLIDLLVCPTLLRELEKVRVGHRVDAIRDRASALSRWLSETLQTDARVTLRSNVELIFVASDPTVADFRNHNLSELVTDDWLLATALAYSSKSSAAPTLVTADGPLLLKSRFHKLNAIRLPEELRLASTVDQREQELKVLRKQLAAEQSRKPDLVVSFRDGDTRLQIRKPDAVSLKPLDTFLSEAMQALRSRYSKLDYSGSPRQRLALLIPPSKFEIDKYNEELDTFFSKYEDHLDSKWTYLDLARRSFPVHLLLLNSGQAVASDIDIRLELPADISARAEPDLPEPDQEPIAPKLPEPRSAFSGYDLSSLSDYSLRAFDHALRDSEPPTHSGPEMDADGKVVTFWARQLKHHREFELPSFFVVFESNESIRSFNCSVTIHAAEMADLRSARLDFVVVESSGQPSKK